MKLFCWVLSLAFGLLVGVSTASAVDGTFLGKVAAPPANEPTVKGWIFVEGRNHMLRRVEVAHAVIVFSEEVPASQRHNCNSECLSPGQEVRVTAHQDETGEWRAKRVEIIRLTTGTNETRFRVVPLPNFTGFGVSHQVTKEGNSCIATSTGEI
jgi:hypothetical protein